MHTVPLFYVLTSRKRERYIRKTSENKEIGLPDLFVPILNIALKISLNSFQQLMHR